LSYQDYGEYWRSFYTIDDFEMAMDRLWQQVRPLYEQLHAYVRRRLIEVYGKHADKFPASGHIPAHLTGDFSRNKYSRCGPIDSFRVIVRLKSKFLILVNRARM
jgi:peptidyl-dipeptidase A